jgi:hypothetical protein
MRAGNWIPIDRNVIYDLSPTAKEGQYSEQSAYLSLREDLEKDQVKGLRDYGRMWKWSPKKVFTFFEKIGYKTGQNLEEIKETKWKQLGNKVETHNYIIFNDLSDTEKTNRKQSGNNQETHTINPNPNPNKKTKKKGTAQSASPTPSEIAKNFFSEFYNPETRNGYFAKYSSLISDETELEKYCSYWTEKSKSGKLERWQLQKTFELRKRMQTWQRNFEKWGMNRSNSSSVGERYHYAPDRKPTKGQIFTDPQTSKDSKVVSVWDTGYFKLENGNTYSWR